MKQEDWQVVSAAHELMLVWRRQVIGPELVTPVNAWHCGVLKNEITILCIECYWMCLYQNFYFCSYYDVKKNICFAFNQRRSEAKCGPGRETSVASKKSGNQKK